MIPPLACVTAAPFLLLPAAAAAGTAGGISLFAEQTLIKSDGTNDYTGQASPWDAALAKRVQGLSNIRAVSANDTRNLAIDGESRLWFWGSTVTGYSDRTETHEQPAPVLLAG
ncbi:hypothetical protein [Cohnella zeiphila]|uniref:Uncharacterized protein n=1 Tax=Cohnella zeiphila TaxID=2761120 RepID=A0A7X0VW33_9BACL|nr:hypothetical protein [Cohnella zeiphila]MBB6730538.1 hypothetical protein [Cohnella zeiphila]